MNKLEIAKAFQDYFPKNPCFGCGPANPNGLQIKSYWLPEDYKTICSWEIKDFCFSRDKKILHGGIIASLIDCHSIWSAIAWCYRLEKKEMGIKPDIVYVTANLNVNFLKPVPININSWVYVVSTIELQQSTKKKIVISSLLSVDDNPEVYASGKVTAVCV